MLSARSVAENSEGYRQDHTTDVITEMFISKSKIFSVVAVGDCLRRTAPGNLIKPGALKGKEAHDL